MKKTATELAIIDIGSNSIRFALSEGGGLSVKRVYTTRLGSGLADTGRLADSTMQRSMEVIASLADEARAAGFTPVAYATSAVRDAANGREFAKRILKEAGVPVAVLSGEEEARLAFLGACAGGRFDALLDIGGASMQIVTAETGVSFRTGCVRCADIVRGVTDGLPEDGRLACDIAPYEKRLALREYVDKEVGVLPREYRNVCGVGGTITTLAAFDLGLAHYDDKAVDGHMLTPAAVKKAIDRIIKMGPEARRLDPCLAPRHDVIFYGACILERALELMHAETLTVSIRDGMEGFFKFGIRNSEFGIIPSKIGNEQVSL